MAAGYFECAVATVRGRRERVRCGGYLTRREAVAARDALVNRSADDRGIEAWTVGRWLRYWLTTRTSIRPSTLRSYTEHVDDQRVDRGDLAVRVPLQRVEAVWAEDERGVGPAGQLPGHVRSEVAKPVQVGAAEPGAGARSVVGVRLDPRRTRAGARYG
jgi:hypothetical protein